MTKAFTLVELLVVIAIVAILAAILFPVFSAAKSAALETQSMSNLKQIGLAWTMYNQDYDDTMMRVSETASPTKTIYWWASWDGIKAKPQEGLLYPYTRSQGVVTDPTFPNNLRSALALTGYGYNYVYLSPSTFDASFNETDIPRNYSSINRTAETVAFASSARINNWAYPTPTLEGNTFLEPPSSAYPTFQARNAGRGLVLWTDTHAKSFAPVYRQSAFGFGFNSVDFIPNHLGDIDKDGNLTTDELFSGN